MQADLGATRVGLMFDLISASASVEIQARSLSHIRGLGPWRDVEITWNEGGAYVARVDFDGVVDSAQIRLSDASAGNLLSLTWSVLVPQERAETGADEQLMGAGAAQSSDSLSTISAHDRYEWEARVGTCTLEDRAQEKLTIHHSATAKDLSGSFERRLRQMQSYHMDTRNYCDIGYHYLISDDGSVWQGRDQSLMGAHVGGKNDGNLGVALVGCFADDEACPDMGSNLPSDAMLDGLAQFIAEATQRLSIEINDANVLGHQEWGRATLCPGENVLIHLDGVRDAAQLYSDNGSDSGGGESTGDGQGTTVSEAASSTGAGGPCGDINYGGMCDGNLLKWCWAGQLQVYDCEQSRAVCGWQNPYVGYNCLLY